MSAKLFPVLLFLVVPLRGFALDAAPAEARASTTVAGRAGPVATGVCPQVARDYPQFSHLLAVDASGAPQVLTPDFEGDCGTYVVKGVKQVPSDVWETGKSLYGLLVKAPLVTLRDWLKRKPPEAKPAAPPAEDGSAPPSFWGEVWQNGKILWCLKPEVRTRFLCMETARQAGFGVGASGVLRGAKLLAPAAKAAPVVAETSTVAQERLAKIAAGRGTAAKSEAAVAKADPPSAPTAVEQVPPALPKSAAATSIEYRDAPVITGVKDYQTLRSASRSQNGGLATGIYEGKEVFLKHPVPGNPIYARVFDREATNALHASEANVGPRFYGTTTVNGKRALVMEKLDGELIHDFNVQQEFAGAVRGASRAELEKLSTRLETFDKYIHKYEISAIDFQVMLTKDKNLYIIDTAHFIPRGLPETPLLLRKMKELVADRLRDLH